MEAVTAVVVVVDTTKVEDTEEAVVEVDTVDMAQAEEVDTAADITTLDIEVALVCELDLNNIFQKV